MLYQLVATLFLTLATAVALTPVAHGAPADCIRHFDPSQDYFPHKAHLRFAREFTLAYHKSYKVLTVHQANAGRTTARYILLQCGAPVPKLVGPLAAAPVIRIPIKTLFTSSSTQVALLVELDRLSALAGVDKAGNQTEPSVIAAARAGRITSFATRGIVNVEKVIQAAPSLVLSNGLGERGYMALAQAGVPVVSDTDWLEHTALGRAEWIKFLAAFFNAEDAATTQFNAIVQRYLTLKARIATAVPENKRPSVMTGQANRGAFTTSGGHSYVAALIHDAGGRYVWADNPDTGSVTVDIEAELKRAAQADFWINAGIWPSLASMRASDPRYRAFKAFRDGEVWLYNRRVSANGANDYWARAMARPDLVLADLVKIFHPRLVPKHAFQWYKRVPAE